MTTEPIIPSTTPNTLPTDTNTGATLVAVPNPPVETVVTPEPVVAPVVEASVETPAPKAETLLADGIDKNTPKPVETPAPETVVEAPNVTEGGQSDETAPPPKYDAFTLPEGVSLDEERVGKFTTILSELETSGKVDHALVQAFGQKAVDFHVAEIKNAVDSVTKLYQDTWNTQVTSWKNDFMADPVIGGNRFQTTVDSALDFIRTHGGTAEEQKEFRDVMESSGLGNHRAVLRILANAGRAMSEGKPLAATHAVSAPKSKVETLYGAAKK